MTQTLSRKSQQTRRETHPHMQKVQSYERHCRCDDDDDEDISGSQRRLKF